MLNDSRIWGQDSADFNPDRFLSKNESGLDLPDPTWIPFGFGRRYVLYLLSCPFNP